MSGKGGWHAWTDTEWRDEVAPDTENLGRLDQDLESFLEDMRDMARTIVECTVEPLRAFAESFPRSMAFETNHWQRHWGRGWRHARRRWRR